MTEQSKVISVMQHQIYSLLEEPNEFSRVSAATIVLAVLT